jgi:hypothetical protein
MWSCDGRGRTDKDSALATIADWLSDAASNANPLVSIVAGFIYCGEENYIDALKACHHGRSLEQMALCVQVLSSLHDHLERCHTQLRLCDGSFLCTGNALDG